MAKQDLTSDTVDSSVQEVYKIIEQVFIKSRNILYFSDDHFEQIGDKYQIGEAGLSSWTRSGK